MRFYYRNYIGNNGYFSEKDLVKAIYAAWNIEADLYLLNNGVKKINEYENFSEQCELIFVPYGSNEFNSKILEKYGYYMQDGEGFREIVNIKTNKEVKYDWSEVKQLI